jgi:hypothetical protein
MVEQRKPTQVVEFRAFAPAARIDNTALIPLAESILDGAGIPHYIQDAYTHDLVGHARFSTGGYNVLWTPTVLVDPDRVDEARSPLEGLTGSGEGSFRRPSLTLLAGSWLFAAAVLASVVMAARTIRFELETLPTALLAIAGAAIAIGLVWRVTSSYLAQQRSIGRN